MKNNRLKLELKSYKNIGKYSLLKLELINN